MVAPLRSLLPPGGVFQGYALRERLTDACRLPLQVYTATDGGDGRACRLYCMEAVDPTPAGRARFPAQLELLRRIEHERIPRLLRGGVDAGLCWVAVEAIEGVSLAEAMTTGRRLDPMHAVMMLRDAVAPLRLARDAGVLHGRLTPRRVLTSAAECRAVLELGFDRLFGLPDEGHDIVFRAPEQLDPAGEADERTDIYALGALAYFGLGAPPFEDTGGAYDVERIRRRIVMEEFPPLARVRPDCPVEVEGLLRFMCAKLKVSRPRCYEELEEMLERALGACVARRRTPGATRPPAADAAEPEPSAMPARAPLVAPPVEPTTREEARPANEGPDHDVATQSTAFAQSDQARPPLSPPPAADRGRSELRIVTIAVASLGCVAVVVSLGVVRLAWSSMDATPRAAATQVARSVLPLPSLTPPAPPPEPQASAPPAAIRPRAPAKSIPPAASARPSAEPPRPKVSAIDARARSMKFPSEDL